MDKPSEQWRISSDPAILSGKPCIRGMRIRVADILELLAHGATRQDIFKISPIWRMTTSRLRSNMHGAS